MENLHVSICYKLKLIGSFNVVIMVQITPVKQFAICDRQEVCVSKKGLESCILSFRKSGTNCVKSKQI